VGGAARRKGERCAFQASGYRLASLGCGAQSLAPAEMNLLRRANRLAIVKSVQITPQLL